MGNVLSEGCGCTCANNVDEEGQFEIKKSPLVTQELIKIKDKSVDDLHDYSMNPADDITKDTSQGNMTKSFSTFKSPKFEDSLLSSIKDSGLSGENKYKKILNFKDFKGFKKVENIKERYKIGRVLGEGSFGQVRIAMHRQAEIKSAIKIIRKDKIAEHKILTELMHNELQILEETSHPNIMRVYELLHDDKFYFVVSEFIRYGELYDYIV